MQTMVCAVLVYCVLSPYQAGAVEYDAKDDVVETRVLGEGEWDSYLLHADDRHVEIKVMAISGGAVDFYIMTKAQFADYKDEEAVRFGFIIASERAAAFSWADTEVNYVLVLDNAEITTTGAVPVGNVSYELSIRYTEKGFFESQTWGISNVSCTLCGVTILLALITTSWLYSAPKQYREKAEQLKAMNRKV